VYELQLSPETALLLACARGQPRADEIGGLAKGGVDWPRFISLAERHDLAPLCFWRLQQCDAAVPAEVSATLRGRFEDNARRNLFLTGELLRIVDLFERNGVPIAAFKGPALAWRIYENPGMRQYLDLDLLVPRSAMTRSIGLLAELGYRPELRLPKQLERSLLETGGQVVLIHDELQAIVDLHWNLAPRSLGLALDAETLWPGLRPLRIAGGSALSFTDTDQLALSAWHGGKHGWTTLSWLADIAAILERGGIEWERLLADARTMRICRSLLLALRLARELLQAPVPSDALKQAAGDPVCERLARDARAFLLDGSSDRKLFSRKLGYQLELTEGRFRQVKLLWRKATEPSTTDWESAKAPDSLVGVYRVTRPVRLAAKYAMRTAARLRKTSGA
jgi:Uncharacterised nucleotidyltransferase